MVKELHMIAIIDYRTNELKAEVRRRLMASELSEQEAVHLVDKACDDMTDAISRLYSQAEL